METGKLRSGKKGTIAVSGVISFFPSGGGFGRRPIVRQGRENVYRLDIGKGKKGLFLELSPRRRFCCQHNGREREREKKRPPRGILLRLRSANSCRSPGKLLYISVSSFLSLHIERRRQRRIKLFFSLSPPKAKGEKKKRKWISWLFFLLRFAI